MNVEDIDRALLEFIRDNVRSEGTLASGHVIDQVCRQLNIRGPRQQQVVITAFYNLFLRGIVSFGRAANQPEPAWIHLTEHGRNTLENVSRDPANPAGYKSYIDPFVPEGTVARSYVEEALATYGTGCNKAAAVMIGAASEALILELRDKLVAKMNSLSVTIPKKMKSWQIKTALTAVQDELAKKTKDMPRELAERFDAFMGGFANQLRMSRNEAGHPKSIEPVTRDTVHASLLMFPEIAKLTHDLKAWITASYS